jgi:hypothetical protein
MDLGMPPAEKASEASTAMPRLASITTTDEMSDDREFRDKWQRRIDGCGPYCSCLVIIIVLALAFFAFVIR